MDEDEEAENPAEEDEAEEPVGDEAAERVGEDEDEEAAEEDEAEEAVEDDEYEEAAEENGEDSASRSTESQVANDTSRRAASVRTRDSRTSDRGKPAQEAYKPGAIVRIKVTDFVTYTSAEFFPGPKLNMVIGPNGTGKSTLVCAICLGLGWGPQHLGRAKDPGEFVKHGCREAIIEIELAGGPRFRRNPVVSRTIKRDGNKSTFTLNGKQASRNQVLKLAQSFAIQIDNLCQFLPQDKVSEFAALTPIELLNSTQRAAAGEEMIEWHDNLKRLRGEQKKLQMDNQGDRDMLANLEDRQEMQREDVERMRQRAQIKRKIEMLEFARPVTQYKEAHNKWTELKGHRDRIHEELDELKAQLEPALRSVNAKQQYCLQVDEVIKYKTRSVEDADRAASALAKKIEQHEESMKDFDHRIEAEKKSGHNYRQDAAKAQQAIHKLKRQLEEESVELDVDWYNERIREKRREVRDIEEKAHQIKNDRRPLFDSIQEKADQIKQTERQLKDLDSVSGRQEAKLRQLSEDTLRAYHWIQKNQDKFEKEVFGPPVITCSVKDPRYANIMESLLQRNDFIAFTAQTTNDFKSMQKYLTKEQNLHDISIRTCSQSLQSFRRPVSDDEMRSLGLEGWAMDYLDGPEPVLAMLVGDKGMEKTPISLRDVSPANFERLKTHEKISSWVSGSTKYVVSRRKIYGPDAVSTMTRKIRPARVWTSQPVNLSEKEGLLQRISTLKGEAQEIQETMEGEKAKLGKLQEEYNEIDGERKQLEKEKADKQTALTNYRAIPERIRQQEVKLGDAHRHFDGIKTRVAEIRSEQDQVSIQKAEATIEYASAVEKLQSLHEELTRLKVQHIEGFSDLEALKVRNTEHRQMLEDKRGELKEAQQELKAASEAVKKLQKEIAKIAQVSQEQDDLRECLSTLVDHDVAQLEADIDSEKARLEFTHGGNSNVIKEFEERGRQIEKLRTKLTDFRNKLADYNHAIDEIRAQWEPKLDAIIKSISDAFSDSFARIGCAGQVTLDKVEEEPGADGEPGSSDFDQWSIQIHVKFREHENLSLLDSHRQSGGERAVSTIFYLMALQSLSASPFRVVDEINQGMDPRNERMVHGRLVEIACAPASEAGAGGGGGQYFLITPKLLSGLVYQPGMRVLCIYSGEHMPEDYNLVNFRGAVTKKMAIMGGPASNQSNGRVSVH
ncbi:P-loop containing nucleoside triphosphate hydrolase protein [Aspergillus heteromorphus CBS 117.55]|uniref:Structural maintenance of chromosomes protein 5 n=1 Tax=Aspergillus heteromorphus CBS 117.55 TaxID=1448321 RepID=A0A317WB88_9EURO|nr:P-loop containing nucleoside triphosphate hydrolase protein [Aspergillus heteromorphus CBS 117.55]PWY83459.1 P-loop containing nucleoside triphosphate hydrolase protein [Aspergillus heteromorphus CBS 117.55]